MTGPEIDEWERDENWYGGFLGVYHAPRDPRVWVPRRPPRLGWTVNLARRASWLWLLAVLVTPLAIIAIADWFGVKIR